MYGKMMMILFIGMMFIEVEFDLMVIVGGWLCVSGMGVCCGKSDYLVVEVDEFDCSFFSFVLIIVIIIMIDVDYFDIYVDFDDIQQVFVIFVFCVLFFGQVIVCVDDFWVQEILLCFFDWCVVIYGFLLQVEFLVGCLQFGGGGIVFEVCYVCYGVFGLIELLMLGEYNVQNVFVVVVVGIVFDMDFVVIVEVLVVFCGVYCCFECFGIY